MDIRSFLGLPQPHQAAHASDAGAVRAVVDALDGLDEARARYIAAFGYILGRVALADLKISPEETAEMERIIMERADLPAEQAMVVVQTAKTHNQLFGGTENFLVTREFHGMATRAQKMALLDAAFAVAAAEGNISAAEDNEIRQIASELRLDHPDFIAVRSQWKDQLAVFQNLPRAD